MKRNRWIDTTPGPLPKRRTSSSQNKDRTQAHMRAASSPAARAHSKANSRARSRRNTTAHKKRRTSMDMMQRMLRGTTQHRAMDRMRHTSTDTPRRTSKANPTTACVCDQGNIPDTSRFDTFDKRPASRLYMPPVDNRRSSRRRSIERWRPRSELRRSQPRPGRLCFAKVWQSSWISFRSSNENDPYYLVYSGADRKAIISRW